MACSLYEVLICWIAINRPPVRYLPIDLSGLKFVGGSVAGAGEARGFKAGDGG